MQVLFIDTDVVIDFLLDREPFSTNAAFIFKLSEQKKIKLFVTPLTFSNVYYVLRKFGSHKKVLTKLRTLLLLTDIQSVNRKSIELALNLAFKDFEDAIQHYSAFQNEKIDLIITRNISDYRNSDFPVMSPETFIKTFK